MNAPLWPHIPLLSVKPLVEFDPTEFKQHIKGLYHKPQPKARPPVKTILAKLTKTGNLSILIRRKPKWISREEIAEVAKNFQCEERLVWNYVAKKKIKVSDAKTEGEIAVDLSSIPW